MRAEELRSLQAPLKERYREDPGAAEVTLTASGNLDEGISCSVRTGAAVVADFRGTLGVGKDAPVGFKSIRLRFDLTTDATPEQLDTLIRLTERYCVVLQTLTAAPELTTSFGSSAT